MRLVASCGYLVVICYVGSKIVWFGFGISLGVIWDLLIWCCNGVSKVIVVFGWIGVSNFQWLLVGSVVAGVSMLVGCYGEKQRRKRHQYFFIKLFVKIRIKILGVLLDELVK